MYMFVTYLYYKCMFINDKHSIRFLKPPLFEISRRMLQITSKLWLTEVSFCIFPESSEPRCTPQSVQSPAEGGTWNSIQNTHIKSHTGNHTLTLNQRITCLVIEEFVYNKTIRKSLNNGAQYVYIIEYKTGVHREFTHDWVWAGLRVTLHTRYLRLMVPQWVISTFRPKQKNIYISDRCNSSSYLTADGSLSGFK